MFVMSKRKITNVLLVIASLMGYLEWGGNQHAFLFQAEATLLQQLFTSPLTAMHPFTILPLLGQLLLIVTLFQKTPNKLLTYLGIGGIGLLLGFLFIIGLMSANTKIIACSLPFILLSIIAIRQNSGNGKAAP